MKKRQPPRTWEAAHRSKIERNGQVSDGNASGNDDDRDAASNGDGNGAAAARR
jgi:hypothetical protein